MNRYDYKCAVFNHSISLFGYLPETKAKVVEAFEGGDVVALSGLRKKAITLLEETDKRYLGKATSRKDLLKEIEGSGELEHECVIYNNVKHICWIINANDHREKEIRNLSRKLMRAGSLGSRT